MPLASPDVDDAPFPRMPRGYRWACLAGSLLAGLLFCWVLSVGHAHLAPERGGSGFYDAQTRALLDGHWDIPPGELSIEAIENDGKTFTYFGPVPALIRMPVLLVTDDLDGRLTQISMLGAFATTMAALSMLMWRVRVLVRGTRGLHRRELAITSLFVFGLGGGSIVVFLASQAVVYHEAILWGIAFALCSYLQQVGFLVAPGRRTLGLSGIFAGLALLTRASVGAGPVVALGLVMLVYLFRAIRGRSGRVTRGLVPQLDAPKPRHHLLGVFLAVMIPVSFYMAVNYAKFDHPLRLPLNQQVFSDLDPNRQAALADNSGSLFGVKFIPTTLWQYSRPDAVEPDGLAPWINFPRQPTTVVGDVTFDTLDEASSIPVTMPLLAVLGVVGVVALCRPPPRRGPDLRVLRLPVVGAAAGAFTVLTIAFVANRYLGDAFPLLALLAIAGLHRLGRWFGAKLRAPSVLVGGVLLVLGLWGVAANLAFALEYQRLIAPADPSDRAAFIGFQYDLPFSDTSQVTQGPPLEGDLTGSHLLPSIGPRGAILIMGDCDGMYWSDGFSWSSIDDPDVCRTVRARVR